MRRVPGQTYIGAGLCVIMCIVVLMEELMRCLDQQDAVLQEDIELTPTDA